MTEHTLTIVQNAVQNLNDQARQFKGSFTHQQVINEMMVDLILLDQTEALDAKNKIAYFADFIAEFNETDQRWYPNQAN